MSYMFHSRSLNRCSSYVIKLQSCIYIIDIVENLKKIMIMKLEALEKLKKDLVFKNTYLVKIKIIF